MAFHPWRYFFFLFRNEHLAVSMEWFIFVSGHATLVSEVHANGWLNQGRARYYACAFRKTIGRKAEVTFCNEQRISFQWQMIFKHHINET